MLNYKKIPTANLEVIKEEINTAFVQLSGWNSYEEFINYKNESLYGRFHLSL